MKRFYVHYEGEPEYTYIAKWTGREGTFYDLSEVPVLAVHLTISNLFMPTTKSMGTGINSCWKKSPW